MQPESHQGGAKPAKGVGGCRTKSIRITHGDDSCNLVLIEGAEPDALAHSLSSRFHLGHRPFHLTFPDDDAVVPLTSSLPGGLTLMLHVQSHHHHHGLHHHHGHHGHHHLHAEQDFRPVVKPDMSVAASTTASEALSAPLLSGSAVIPHAGTDERERSHVELDSVTRRKGSKHSSFGEVDDAAGAGMTKVTLQIPDHSDPGDTFCSTAHLLTMEEHEAAMEASAAAMAESARTIDRFSRLTSELANERTLLAWIRTGLAAIRTVFPFFALIGAVTQPGWKMLVTGSQLAMMTAVLFAGVSGSMRYVSVRKALRLPDPPQGFGRVSIMWFNGMVAISYIGIAVGIFTLSWLS